MVPAPWARHAAAMLPGGRRHRRPPHAQRRARVLPLGPDHPRPVAAVAATAGSPARSTTCGSTPTPTRCCASAGPRSSGRWPGASTSRHLAPHLTAITLRPEFFDVYLELAVEFRLPIRLPSTITPSRPASPSASWPPRRASSSPTTSTTTGGPAAATACSTPSRRCQPGVTEIHVQPAVDTPEVRALSPTLPRPGSTTSRWSSTTRRSRALLAEVGAVLIGYSELRDAQRAA